MTATKHQLIMACAMFALIIHHPAHAAEQKTSSRQTVKKPVINQSQPLRVGIFGVRRAAAVDEIKKTLDENGFETGIVKSGKKNEFAEIHDYDVIFFGGGWSSYNWISFKDRMHLVEFVEQRGGGVVFSMFRCGTAARSMIRPLFPEVADAYNKVNSRGIIAVDPGHPVMKGLPDKFLLSYWDHAVMRLGPHGRALAVNTADEIAIACGDAGFGRVVFLGSWIGIPMSGKPVYPLPDIDKQLLLNSVRWAGGSKYRNRDKSVEPCEKTQFKVLRRELILDWTHADRGKSWWPGLLTRARNLREQELDDLAFLLFRYNNIAENTGSAGEILDLEIEIARLKDELRANHAQASKQKILEISQMSLDELKAEPVRDLSYRKRKEDRETIVEEWRCRLLFPHQVDPVAEKVRALQKRLEPELEKYNRAQIQKAREEDSKNLPSLVKSLKSSKPGKRAAATLEIARIGAPETARNLIEMLEDPEYVVRRNAIYGLSWTQCKDAVPALMKLLAKSRDTLTRRRVAQALGQIGDARAVNCLVKAAEKDKDIHVRHNAILALGWTGDKKAVGPLLRIAEAAFKQVLEENSDDKKSAAHNINTLACAVRALGYIGDQKTLPLLENEDMPDFTASFRSSKIDLAAEAVDFIKKGGRGEKGIRQIEAMREKENFYWMKCKYNALFGRYTSYRYQPESSDIMLSYAAAAGGTGTIEFNTTDKIKERHPDIDVDHHFERASQLGLKINTQMPTLPTRLNKALYEREIMRLAVHPSFGGFWLEECVSLDGPVKLDGDEPFRRFLRSKYSSDELAGLGIKDVSSVTMPQPDDGKRSYERDGARADKVIFAEYMEYAADIGVDDWRETQEWLAGMRKGAKLSFSMSSRYTKGGSTFISAYPRINLVLDAAGPQSYGAHSSLNNFNLDMHVDGEPRPAQGEFYAHQADTSGRVERGYASSFVYGQQFFNWWWGHIFKHAPEGNAGSLVYDHGRWEAAVRQFTKGAALSEYLAPGETRGAGLVTQLYSGRTTTLTYGDGMIDSFGGGGKIARTSPSGYPLRYTQNQVATRECIMQSHLPLEMTWLETQSPDKLAGYRVAILADAVSMAEIEVDMLREWVRAGGTLIVTASSSLHDQWDRPQKNYSLADVFGVDYGRTGGKPSLVYVERDLKPETGISEIAVKAEEYLDLMENGINKAEYEKMIGYDVITPTTAKTVAVWDDETPAITENSFGKGHCIFISARYPALSHMTREWTVDNLYNEYWPGMRELLGACLRRGLELAGAGKLPVTVENCPTTVDAVLKRQEQNKRWMIHLLNMDQNNGLITGVNVTVMPPGKVKAVYYAYPERKNAEYVKTIDGVKFMVRPFDVHEMVVVEWK